MPNNSMADKQAAFARLLDIMDDLRLKCPWDKKQTLTSLRNLTIEEVYELADAILNEDIAGVKEEIGDLMLHMVFYAKMGDELGSFDVADALHAICDKLVARHPHIYGDVVVKDEEEVKANWEKLKLKEGKKSVLAGVPESMPAMVKAFRIQEKTAKVGFDWHNSDQVWEKVLEEVGEFKETLQLNMSQEKREEEFGDLLFALVNYARFMNIDPETALERTNKKFKRRFEYIETQKKRPFEELSLDDMELLWQEAKQKGL